MSLAEPDNDTLCEYCNRVFDTFDAYAAHCPCPEIPISPIRLDRGNE